MEDELLGQIAEHLNDATVYAEYRTAYQQLGSVKLGSSTHDKMNREAFARIEQKLFTKRVLKAPDRAARTSVRRAVHQPARPERLRQGTRTRFRRTAQRAHRDERDSTSPVNSNVPPPTGTQPSDSQSQVPGSRPG